MKVTEPEDAQQYADLFEATIRQAVGGAHSLMARLVAHVRASLRAQEDESRERRERDRLTALVAQQAIVRNDLITQRTSAIASRDAIIAELKRLMD